MAYLNVSNNRNQRIKKGGEHTKINSNSMHTSSVFSSKMRILIFVHSPG